jgi:hypothetical protein
MTYHFTKERVLEAISGTFGVMSTVAKRLDGITWHTAETYVNRWAETRQAFADENERALDLSESKMLEAIHSGDAQMIRFHLATKGKRRGYTEKTEQEMTVRLKIVYGEDPDSAPAEVPPSTATGES